MSDTKYLPPTPDGFEVYHWPEFKALCGRLGVAWDLKTRSLTITIACDAAVEITQTYLGDDRGPLAEEIPCQSESKDSKAS